MNILGLIPARGGSKRCPRKNARPLPRPNGAPLVAWSVNVARQCPSLDAIVVSTEDEEIADIALRYGADVIARPEDLAADDASSYDVITHALDEIDAPFDYVVLLQPTSPFRAPLDVEVAVTLALSGELPSVASREEGRDAPNGAVYVGRCDWLRDGGNWDAMHEPTFMPGSRSLDIDTEEDFEMAERTVRRWAGIEAA